MSLLLYYLIQVIIASGTLYLYYHIALRNKKFHQYNRFYLLGATVISILVPFLNIPVYFTEQETQSSIVLETLTAISTPVAGPGQVQGPAFSETASVSAFNMYDLLYYAYILIAVLAFIKITWSIIKISRLKRTNEVEKIDSIFFVNTNEPGTPFSFFRWMFWNREIELRSEKGEQIFRHELFHIQQKHSIDLLFMELLTVVFWINPFFHLMKKELRAIHEFLADRFAINRSNKWEYAELLLMQALHTKQTLVSPFFHNQIKRRIAMITNSDKTSYRYIRKLLVLPIAVLIVALFAFQYKKSVPKDIVPAKRAITVIIDAGHRDSNSPYTNKERQFSLEISRTIQDLSKEYNINVVIARQGIIASTDNDLYQKRLFAAEQLGAVAFISFDVELTDDNMMPKKHSEYVSMLHNHTNKKSGFLAKALLSQLSRGSQSPESLKGFDITDETSNAGVVECSISSHIDNLSDLSDKQKQEEIAKQVLAGLVQYSNKLVANPDTLRFIQDTITKAGNVVAIFNEESEWDSLPEKKSATDLPVQQETKPDIYTAFISLIEW